MPGVIRVVRDGRFLGVVAEREEQAIDAARRAGKCRRAGAFRPHLPDPARVHEHLKGLRGIDTQTVNEKTGAAGAAVKTHTATYSKPYLAHASIGPSCAVAGLVDNVWTVWSHTQGPYPLRGDLAKVTGIPLGTRARDPCAGRGLLRPQRRGRCRARCAADVGRDAGPDHQSCNGCATTNSAGSRSARRWRCRYARGSMQTARSSIGSTMCGPARTTCGRAIRTGMNLLAAGHLAMPFRALEAGRSAACRRRRRPQRGALLRIPQSEDRRSFHHRDAAQDLGAENARRVRQCVRARILHGRIGASRRRRSGRVPLEASRRTSAAAPCSKPRRRRRNGRQARAATATRGRGVAYSRYETIKAYVAMIVDVTVDRATGVVKVDRVTAAVDAGQIDQSRRGHQPNRGRHHPGRELDAERIGEIRPRERSRRATG